MIDAAPSTVVVFADFLDPFAHVAVHRLWQARARLDLDEVVTFIPRAFPLELFNGPGTRIGSDSEIPALGAIEPEAGWQLWNSPDWHYPNTVLLAFEAVHAAEALSPRGGERLDRALRQAFWGKSRSIGHLTVILDVAERIGLDRDKLEHALLTGSSRPQVLLDYTDAQSDDVPMTPTLFVPGGRRYPNPGLTVHWEGAWAKGFPVVDNDAPEIYDEILLTAAEHRD